MTDLGGRLKYDLYRSGTIYSLYPSSRRVSVKQLDSPMSYPVRPFDFRMLGLGMYGDLATDVSLEGVIHELMAVRLDIPEGTWDEGDASSVVTYDYSPD